jgi:DNA-binding IclR family transcriptional regulator
MSAALVRASALGDWVGDPGRIGLPVRIAALSEAMRTPGETVRRHLHELAALGFCRRAPGGFVAVAPAVSRLALVRLADTNGVGFRRLFGRLDQLGMLAAWAAA